MRREVSHSGLVHRLGKAAGCKPSRVRISPPPPWIIKIIMCGIVGYIGKRNAQEVLLIGLKRLEYRGYDSAGIAVVSKNGKIKHTRAVGKVAELEKKLSKARASSACAGIAHTRWATHGKPAVKNAHPHEAGDIYLVHNGIIENYQELKNKLNKKGCKFTSDTDSEVLAHLIDLEHKKGTDLRKSVRQALAHVQGAYALAVMSANEPGVLVAARMSSPLVLGVGDGEYILASDAAAIVPYTKRVIYLEDGEIAEVSSKEYRVTTLEDKKRHKKECELEWGEEEAKLEGYQHFMLKEIHEQPDAIREAVRGRSNPNAGEVKLGGLDSVAAELRDIKRIVITSCGTSYNAGLIGEYLFESVAGIPTEVEYASEFRYREAPIDDGTAVLAISQSGETADTLAAVKEAKKKKALTLGIVNAVGSTIARDTDAGVYNHAGPEIAVASTKALISQVSILLMFTVFLGRQRKMKRAEAQKLLQELDRLPVKIEKWLKKNTKIVEKIAKKYSKFNNLLYIGRKYQFPVALEGALKIKELAYIHAEGYAAGEMKHGPIALIDKSMPSIVVAPKDSVYEKTLGAIEEIKARGGQVLAITTPNAKEVIKLADDVIIIPKTEEALMSLLTILPVQLLSYYAAVARGHNVDKPRNLAKSVTVE